MQQSKGDREWRDGTQRKLKTMNTIDSLKFPDQPSRRVIAIACAAALLVPAYSLAYAQQDQPPAANEEASPIPAEQLDSLVAPIALYPDPLLAQTLAASTYPLEVIQLEQWYANNKYLKDKALADAVAKQPWDPSVQALVAFPDVVQRMAGNIQWTTDLGNAFLAQQSDVMDAVQRMRAKAQGKGNLQTNAQQNVETQTVEGGEQVIVIEQANPEVVYVPSYDPQMVYGAPPPAYPYYPYTYPGYYAGMGLAFGTGLVLGGIWANNWGNCNWKHGDVNINNNNNFNRNVNRNVNRGTGTGQWQHNPQHRGNAPYGNRQTANKYGGTARGESSARGAGARPSGSNIGGGNRPGGGGAQNIGAGNRPGGGAGNISGGNRPGGGAGASRAGGGTGQMPAIRPTGAGGGNGIGNRSVSSGSGFGSSSNTFGGGGFNGSSARSAGNRGGASMGGGGFSQGGAGGGARGGGGRGGGGGGGRRR
jgi:hypothetical protein